jgi:hypothetical protein
VKAGKRLYFNALEISNKGFDHTTSKPIGGLLPIKKPKKAGYRQPKPLQQRTNPPVPCGLALHAQARIGCATRPSCRE